MNDSLFAKLISALDQVVLVPAGDGHFRQLAALPHWWASIDPNSAASEGNFAASEILPFLTVFLAEAEEFWSQNTSDWLRSGIWQEVLADGDSIYLEALATTIDDQCLLVIRRADELANERMSLIQKGRDNKLAYQLDIAQREQFEAELQRAKQAAEELSEAKTAFLAKMSHELRTPMNGVLGMTRLLLDSNPTKEQRGYLEAVETSADTLLSLINDILDFSKIDAGKMQLVVAPFQLRELIDDTLKLLAVLADQKELELTCDVDSNVPKILSGDSVRLRQIILNLVGNAIKFTNEGSVTVTIKQTETTNAGIHLRFSVRDTGIGIPETRQAEIFDAFSQAHAAHSYTGTGLGLSIAAQLVELMNGQIWIENSSSTGTTFCFTAQFDSVLQSADEPTSVTNVTTDRASRPLRVLLADDNDINQHLAIKMLEKRGHAVVAVGNGKEAVDAYKNKAFDVVLMDCQMPEMDGFEATRRIREAENQSGRHRVPVIALTAQNVERDIELCQQAGMDERVVKPIDYDHLNKLMIALASSLP